MNEKIKTLIVDDEPLARRGIRQLLETCADVEAVGEARNGREALTALDALAPDLVFLDVQMPELDGFEVVRARGAARMPYVIFVTAYDEFAVRAFETHALDYLVKPVNEVRFAAAMQRVRERMRYAEALELIKESNVAFRKAMSLADTSVANLDVFDKDHVGPGEILLLVCRVFVERYGTHGSTILV